MNSVTLHTKDLKASLLTAGKGSVRPHLSAVRIEASGNDIRLISTNGAALSLIRRITEDDNGAFIVNIPRGAIEAAVKLGERECRLDQLTASTWRLVVGDVKITFDGNDSFPEFRQLFPSTTSGVPAQFDGSYISAFQKAARIQGFRALDIHIHHNGQGAALVTHKAGCYVGVLMPLSVDGVGHVDVQHAIGRPPQE